MPLVNRYEFTVKDMADRLALCTGDTPAFHARQIRHWAATGVLEELMPTRVQGYGKTAARVFNTRHLAGCLILHFYAGQRGDVEFLSTVAGLMRNSTLDHGDPRILDENNPEKSAVTTDGLGLAMHFARKIARGEKASDWTIYLQISLTRDGTLRAGSLTNSPSTSSTLNYNWVEERTLNVSALLPCMFRGEDGKPNELATGRMLHNGVVQDFGHEA